MLTCSSDKVLAGAIIAGTMISIFNLLKTILAVSALHVKLW